MIKAIFIIHKGVCLFSRHYGKKYQGSQLLSAFLMAINQMAREISQKDLKKLVLAEDTFSFSVIDDILFVYAHDKLKNADLNRISGEISSKFFELFSSEIEDWDGEVSCFDKFQKEADEIVEMKGKSIMLEMERFLQKKKSNRIKKKKKQEIKGKAILIDMEKFLKEKSKKDQKDL
jgi:hypothetical protein